MTDVVGYQLIAMSSVMQAISPPSFCHATCFGRIATVAARQFLALGWLPWPMEVGCKADIRITASSVFSRPQGRSLADQNDTRRTSPLLSFLSTAPELYRRFYPSPPLGRFYPFPVAAHARSGD
jgi:hypothetical protein